MSGMGWRDFRGLEIDRMRYLPVPQVAGSGLSEWGLARKTRAGHGYYASTTGGVEIVVDQALET